jgi:hypothetical protein
VNPVLTLSGARLRSRRFTGRKGTTLTIAASEPATISATVSYRAHGHKVSGRCRTTARHGRRCSLKRTLRLTFRATTGTNTFKFDPARLKPERYTATITARDAAGRSSNTIRLRFTISR